MNVRREGVGSPEPPRDTCAGCQPAPTWAAQSQARCGETRPATAVPNRIGIQAFARSMLTSLRHPWLRLSATPAPGHGQPLAASSRSTGFQPVCLPSSHWARGIIACMCDFGRGSSRIGGTRRSRCDLCNAAVAPKRLSRELTSPAGAEHASGRLRWPFEARGSSTTRLNARRSPRPGHGPAARRRSLWSAVGRPGSVRTPPPPA